MVFDIKNKVNINAATQPEAEIGSITNKYISPSTANPNNYTPQAGSLLLDEILTTRSPTNGLVGGRTMQEVIDLAVATVNVPIGPNVAWVTKGGNDSTAVVGDASKPFLTIDAAALATPSLGIVVCMYGAYTLSVATGSKRIYLIESDLLGTTSGSFIFINGNGTGGVPNIGLGGSNVNANITGNILSICDMHQVGGVITGFGGHFKNIHNWLAGGNLVSGSTPAGYFFRIGFESIGTILCGSYLFTRTAPAGGQVGWINMKNIGRIQALGVIEGYNDFINISLEDIGFADFSSDIFTGNPTVSDQTNSILRIKNSILTTDGGQLVNFGGASNGIKIEAINSVFQVSGSELVNWTGNPANKVKLLGLGVKSNKPWNLSGVVNDTVPDTLVDNNITLGLL